MNGSIKNLMTAIRKLPKRTLWLSLALPVLVVVALSISYISYGGNDDDDNVVTVERGDITSSVVTSGPVQPDNRIDIKGPVAGRAERVLVRMGDKILKGQPVLETSSSERTAVLDAARLKTKGEVKHWEESIPATQIVSPVTGVVIQRNIEPGQSFAETAPLLVVADRLVIETPVDETDLAQVRVGQKATIALDAYPDITFTGAVSEVAFDSQIVNQVTTYTLRVAFDNPPDYIRVGMTANIRINMDTHSRVLVLPTTALKTEDDKYFVLVPKFFGQEPEKRWIQVGLSDGKRAEITEGLREGERVLINSKTGKGNVNKTFDSVSL